MVANRTRPKKATPKRPRAKKKVRLPEPRGRRGHKVVEDDPKLRAWLIEALQRRPVPTLDDLVKEATGTGFAVGRTAIWEFRIAFMAEQERKRLFLDLAQQYNESTSDGHVLDIETAVSNIASARIFQKLLDKSDIDEEARELLDLFRKLQSSSSQRERTRFAVERGIRATVIRIRAQMQELLKRDPDLLRRVLDIIERAAAEVRE